MFFGGLSTTRTTKKITTKYKKLDGKNHKIDFTFCHRSKRSYFIYNR